MFFKDYTEEGKLQKMSPFVKDCIASYFNYTFEFAFLDQVAAVIDRMSENDIIEAIKADELDEYVFNTISEEIIYNDQKFIIVMKYCDPYGADFEEAQEFLTADIIKIIKIMLRKG